MVLIDDYIMIILWKDSIPDITFSFTASFLWVWSEKGEYLKIIFLKSFNVYFSYSLFPFI